jgi:hypothetical protein
LGFFLRFLLLIDQQIQWLASKFPTQGNREIIRWIWELVSR